MFQLARRHDLVTAKGIQTRKTRKTRRRAQRLERELQRGQKAAGKLWEDDEKTAEIELRRREIDAAMERADAASMQKGFMSKGSQGAWQLVNTESPESIFEEALRRCLCAMGASAEQAAEITEKPQGGRGGKRPSASTPGGHGDSGGKRCGGYGTRGGGGGYGHRSQRGAQWGGSTQWGGSSGSGGSSGRGQWGSR